MMFEQQINYFLKIFQDFAQTPLFQDFGLIFLFLYAQTPSIVAIPNEVFTLPLYLAGVPAVVLIVVLGVGGFLGDVWLYLIGKYSASYFRRATKKKPKKVAGIEHVMHKHRFVIFLTPAIPFIPTFFSDIVMLLAGHQNLNLKHIIPIIFLAEMIKAVIIVMTVMGVIDIMTFFR